MGVDVAVGVGVGVGGVPVGVGVAVGDEVGVGVGPKPQVAVISPNPEIASENAPVVPLLKVVATRMYCVPALRVRKMEGFSPTVSSTASSAFANGESGLKLVCYKV